MDKARQEAFEALYKSYTKILRVNLSKDNYHILKMNEAEKAPDKGFSDKLSLWLIDFALSGQVYFDDLEVYASNTNIDFLRKYFKNSNKSLSIRYRRMTDKAYRWVIMELVPAEEYTDENQILFLYVRDVNDNYIAELEIQRELEQSCNTDSLTGVQNFYAYKTKCIRFSNFIKSGSVGAIFCDLNGLKLVNDTKGHAEGNIFINSFAKILKNIFLEEEIFRISGDEFVIVLLAQDKKEALQKLNALKAEIDKEANKKAAVGFAWAEKAKKIEEIVSIAEEKMYDDKKSYYEQHPELRREFFEERLSIENQAIINRLTSSYPTVGIINLQNDNLKMLKFDSIFPTGGDFTRYSKYVKLFKTQYFSEVSAEHHKDFDGTKFLKRRLTNQSSYELKFQLKSGEWREVIFSVIERENDEPVKVLFYAQKLNSIGAEESEKDSKIKKENEILAGLSYDYSLISLVDTKTQEISIYKHNNLPEDLVNHIAETKFEDVKNWFAEKYIVEEDRKDFCENVCIDKICSYLKKEQRFKYYARTIPGFHNTKTNTLSCFLFYKPIEGRNNIVFATKPESLELL